MIPISLKRSPSVWLMTIIAVLFGLITIKSGGTVLFVDGEFRQQVGNYVPFVVWFNFIAGFAYVIAGVGIWKRKRWAVLLAALIALVTLVVFSIFTVYIFDGGLYEQRTLIAMSGRSLLWIFIGYFAYKAVQTEQKQFETIR